MIGKRTIAVVTLLELVGMFFLINMIVKSNTSLKTIQSQYAEVSRSQLNDHDKIKSLEKAQIDSRITINRLEIDLSNVTEQNRDILKAIVSTKRSSIYKLSATAYTASKRECGKKNGDTAMREKVVPGATCAVSRELKRKLGKKRVFIEGIGIRRVNDLMADDRYHSIDIAMHSRDEAIDFGRKKLTVILLD